MKNTKIALIQTSWPGSRAEMIKTYRELVTEVTEAGFRRFEAVGARRLVNRLNKRTNISPIASPKVANGHILGEAKRENRFRVAQFRSLCLAPTNINLYSENQS